MSQKTKKIDLGRQFIASFKAGKHAPTIKDIDRMVVIYHDTEYFAYRSESEEMDRQICETFLRELEQESGMAGDRNIVSAKDVSGKTFYGFDTELEYDLYCVEYVEDGF